MYAISFKPVTPKISLLPEIAKENLSNILADLVYSVFEQALGYHVELDKQGSIKIIVEGVVPISGISAGALAQKISDALVFNHLNELFKIDEMTCRPKPLDRLLAPEAMEVVHYPNTLMQAFNISDERIPERFICPISKEVMHEPVFLPQNSKIHYERKALMKWIAEHNSDPSTRHIVTPIDPISNHDLKKEILSFIMDNIFERDLSKYFNAKKNVETQCASASPFSFFSEKSSQTDTESSISETFALCRLNDEYHSLMSKALRRAVHLDAQSSVEALFHACDVKNIINSQDANPMSKKTALHIAVSRGHLTMIKFLITHGARTDIPDATGETVTNLVTQHADAKIKALFPEVRAQELSKNNSPF